jgi:hypothetical protein
MRVFAPVLLACTLPCAAAIAAPKAPELPAPSVRLAVEVVAGTQLRMTVENQGSVPFELVADARLLRFEVELPAAAPDPKGKARKPTTFECALPASMRKEERTLVLPPAGRYVETFDLRLHCLDRIAQLVAGAKLTPRLGWPAPKVGKPRPPFVARATDPGAPDLASAKEIGGGPFVLAAPLIGAPPANGMWTPSKDDAIEATPGASISSASSDGAQVSIVLRNVSDGPRAIYARPQLIEARVVDPDGRTVDCTGRLLTPNPVADFVTRLPANGRWLGGNALAPLCPPGTFDQPGLYLVTPIAQLPPLPNVPNAASGSVESRSPMLLRIETGKKPFHAAEPKISR